MSFIYNDDSVFIFFFLGLADAEEVLPVRLFCFRSFTIFKSLAAFLAENTCLRYMPTKREERIKMTLIKI